MEPLEGSHPGFNLDNHSYDNGVQKRMFDRPVAYLLHMTARDSIFLEENVKIRPRAVQCDILARVNDVCGSRLSVGSSAAFSISIPCLWLEC